MNLVIDSGVGGIGNGSRAPYLATLNVLIQSSLVPRPSPAPVFDRLQYAKTEGEGLVNLTT